MSGVTLGEQGAQRLRHGQIEANGIEFAILEVGNGPLALCLHGFPDSAYTWRYLLPELGRVGFRAVAPFMRGYAPTGLAVDDRYDLGALAADAVALHEALGGDDQAVLIGSDWGAEAAYAAAASAPERWRRLVTIAVPPLALDEGFFSDYGQIKRFFYLFFFKTPRAESVVAANEMAFLGRLWADWSPGYDASEDLRYVKRCLRDPANLSAAIGYYRANEPEIGHGAASTAETEALLQTAPQPTLYLHGSRDGCIDVSLVSDAERHLSPNSRMDLIEDSGHFLHVERHEVVNERILAWVG